MIRGGVSRLGSQGMGSREGLRALRKPAKRPMHTAEHRPAVRVAGIFFEAGRQGFGVLLEPARVFKELQLLRSLGERPVGLVGRAQVEIERHCAGGESESDGCCGQTPSDCTEAGTNR